MDRVGIAIIGAGVIADYHLAGLVALSQADVRCMNVARETRRSN
jgi:hypothetical protein